MSPLNWESSDAKYDAFLPHLANCRISRIAVRQVQSVSQAIARLSTAQLSISQKSPNFEQAHEFRRWNFNGLVGAEISCKNGRDIRCRGEDRAAFPLVATSREKAASRLPGRPPPVLFLGRKVAYPTSSQYLGANAFSPSPSRAAAICREGSFGDMSGLEKRRSATSLCEQNSPAVFIGLRPCRKHGQQRAQHRHEERFSHHHWISFKRFA